MIHHMCVSPRYLLLRLSPEERLKCWQGDPGMTAEEMTRKLQQDLADGVVYPIGHCDNFDPHRGCLGHESLSDES